MAEKDTSSGSLGRPLPQLDPVPPESAAAAQQAGLDSDNDSGSGGRRHISASVSKTSFTANTPANQKKAIQRLKQSLTFSDDSSHSSVASTPQKSAPTQLGHGSTHSLHGSTHSAPPAFQLTVAATSEGTGNEQREGSGYISEGEAASSGISVAAIMSKLDQVKNYLREAQVLHQQMKERLSEPGMAEQVNKMGRLVEDLRRQESGYLNILVRLLDEVSRTQASATESEGEGSGGGGADSLSEGEMVDEASEEEEEEKEGGDDSMSLKAELLKEKIEAQRAERERQDEEMRMLRQQRDLLKKMVEQQKQIEALEARHRSLLLQGYDGEDGGESDQPPPGAAQTEVSGVGGGPESEEEVESHHGEEQHDRDVSETTNNDQATELAVAVKLQQLRERQARVQQLTTLIHQLQNDDGKDNQSKFSSDAVSDNVIQPQVRAGSDELVAVGSQAPPPQLLELHRKLKEAQEARAKLSRLQQMLTLLHEAEVGEDDPTAKNEPMGENPANEEEEEEEEEEVEEEVEEEESDEEVGTEENQKAESEKELEASILSDYEERLIKRRREVMELQEQRDRLLATQRKLQQLQQSINDSESQSPVSKTDSGARNHSSPRPPPPSAPTAPTAATASAARGRGEEELSPEELAYEMEEQKRLFNELLNKTQEIQSMVNEVTSARDMSGATWGGSSSEEDEDDEEEGSTMTGLDETIEHPYTEGSSAVAVVENEEETVEPLQNHGTSQARDDGGERRTRRESVEFRVTRHTPGRLLRAQSPDVALQSAKKRMKIDSNSGRPVDGGWPGVSFPLSSNRTHNTTASKDDTTQTGRGLAGHQTITTETHISFLHHQLATTSALANQLVAGQQSLIGSVCHQLETLQMADRVNDHFSRLHHYQAQLEQQYHQIQSAFVKLEQAAEDQPQHGVEEEEEETEQQPEEPIYPESQPPPPPHLLPFSSTTTRPINPGSNNDRREPSDSDSRRRDFNPVSNPGWGVPTGQSNPPLSEAYRPSNRQPQPPGAYFPHIYQSSAGPRPQTAPTEEGGGGGGGGGCEGLGRNAPDGCPPPPPPPPFVPPYFHHPFFPPPPPPHLSPWMVPPTPHNMSFPHPSPGYTVGSSTNLPPPASFYPNPPWPPSNFGVSPMYPSQPPLDSSLGLNNSGAGASFFGGYPPFGPPLRGGREESRGGLHPFSPSGVTGVSMQVQPPYSPPSAPSVSNMPLSSSASFQPGLNPGTGRKSALPQAQRLPSSTGPTKLGSLGPSLPKHNSHTGAWAAGSRPEGGRAGKEKMNTTNLLAQDSTTATLTDPSNKRGQEGGEGGGRGSELERPHEDLSVFDSLRDTIYSEVATLIASNENRPHFLVELFRELQLLSTDYLRQRALYALQDLVTRYLTEESVQLSRRKRMGEIAAELQASWSEQTPSESVVTSEDELVLRSGHTTEGEGERRDNEEEDEEERGAGDKDPFSLDTVLRLDKAIARLRGSSGASPGQKMQPPVVSPGPLVSDHTQSTSLEQSGINIEAVHEQIKVTMGELIPVLKEHMNKVCNSELLQRIRDLIVSCTVSQLIDQDSSLAEGFTSQLETALMSSLQKYLDQALRECGEALLVEVSEVLFNELVFFRLIQTMGVQREPELGTLSMAQKARENGEERSGEDGVVDHTLPILQTLTTAVERSNKEEQEALGKTRDDELAKEWSGLHQESSSPSPDGDQTVIAESSTSEPSGPKPMESSGEKGLNIQTTPGSKTGDREETPPTPVVIPPVSGHNGTDGESATQSPPPLPPSDVVQLNIQTKMAEEQKSTNGIAGILATMVIEPELAGANDQIPEPTQTSSETIAEP